MDFINNRVRSVKHIIQLVFEQLFVRLFRVKHIERYRLTFRINQLNALTHQIHLALAHRSGQCMNLTVHVRDVYDILID
ncbi:hypothetical protein D3C73_519300 [compost metagenome]